MVAWILYSSRQPTPYIPIPKSFVHHILSSSINMNEEQPRASTPKRATPGWLPTPPPSAERLLRALSIHPTTPVDKDDQPTYFDYLEHVISPLYQDPPLLSTPTRPAPGPSEKEALFLPDDESDDVEIMPDNRLVSPCINSADVQVIFDQSSSTSAALVPVKRPLDDEDDDEVEFLRAEFAVDGYVDLGPPIPRRVKRRRIRIEPAEPVEEEEQLAGRGELERQDEDTPLREIEPLHRGCQACGCFCNTVGRAPRSSGSGSTTLSPRVLGDLLCESVLSVALRIDVLMGSGHSLLSTVTRSQPTVRSWADIAELIGARREDFDRVRHAASWMQSSLPRKKARGEF